MFLYRVRQRSVKEGGEPRAGRGDQWMACLSLRRLLKFLNFFIKLLHFSFGLGSFEFVLVFNFSRRGESWGMTVSIKVWMRVAQVA